jgi:hypothetical protein
LTSSFRFCACFAENDISDFEVIADHFPSGSTTVIQAMVSNIMKLAGNTGGAI